MYPKTRRKARKLGGLSIKGKSRAYWSYVNAYSRCYRPCSPEYHRYGAAGITMCERWKEFPEVFIEDMGEPPPTYQLDRFPNPGGNYEPDNCRWASPQQQSQNKVSVARVTFQGVTSIVKTPADRLGLNANDILWRLNEGRSAEEAVDMARPKE